MTRFALRQARGEALGVLAVLLAIAAVALVTGRQMDASFQDSGLARCLAASDHNTCADLVRLWETRFGRMQFLIVPLVLLPALLGAALGGPLVARELESGSYRWTWTQGVSRRRWLLVRSAVVVGVAALAAAVYCVVAALWLHTTNVVTQSRFEPGRFDLQGIVPAAYTVFAVALGVYLGARLRHTIAAAALTVAVFVVVRVVVAVWVRPHLAAPAVTSQRFGPEDVHADAADWVLRTQTATRTEVLHDGASINTSSLAGRCPELAGPPGLPNPELLHACVNRLGLRIRTEYHPADRFWAFQAWESGLFVLLAVGLLGLAYRQVTRTLR